MMPVDPPYVQQSRTLSAPEIAWYALKYWSPWMPAGSPAAIAVAVAIAESGGRTGALNDEGKDLSYGLWQINMIGGLGPARRTQFGLKNNEELYDPLTNARVAYGIAITQGWSAWSVYNDGSYKTHMAVAEQAIKNPKQPGGINSGEGQVDTHIGGVILDPLFKFARDSGIRVAGFVGGAGLIIAAVVLLAKRGVK